MTLSGSTRNVARWATPAFSSMMPSWPVSSRLVGEHRERQILQVRMMIAPGVVNEFAVGGAAEDLAIAILEFFVRFTEGSDLGRADEGEILRPEKVQLPLASVVLVGDRLECFVKVFIRANSGSHGKFRKLLAHT